MALAVAEVELDVDAAELAAELCVEAPGEVVELPEDDWLPDIEHAVSPVTTTAVATPATIKWRLIFHTPLCSAKPMSVAKVVTRAVRSTVLSC